MCKCLDTIDQKLASLNTKIDWAFMINPKTGKTASRVHIATAKVDKKKRRGPAVLICAYCPFCGESFHEGGPVKANDPQHNAQSTTSSTGD